MFVFFLLVLVLPQCEAHAAPVEWSSPASAGRWSALVWLGICQEHSWRPLVRSFGDYPVTDFLFLGGENKRMK